MKTRRKSGCKNPPKNKKSILIGVKKNNVGRKNLQRDAKNLSLITKLSTYESPLNHLRNNGPVASTSVNLVKNESSENSNCKTENMSIKELTCPQEFLRPVDKVEAKVEEISDDSIESIFSINENAHVTKANKSYVQSNISKRKKNIITSTRDGKILPNKKRKFNKSPLSKFNKPSDIDKLSDSVILLDDSELEDLQPLQNQSLKNDVEKMSLDNLQLNELPTSNDVTVIIDGNDTIMEMEAYHEKFSKKENPPCDNFLDSVIVIDADEESDDPTQSKPGKNTITKSISPTNFTSKLNEDCILVWSSEPKPSTSNNTHRQMINKHKSWVSKKNSDILKYNKILLNTKSDTRSLKFSNHENNKPLKSKMVKSPKVIKNTSKEPLTKTFLNKSKPTTIMASRASTKIANSTTKTTTTLKKMKSKNDDDLIYTAPREDNFSSGTKFIKGELREIIIDGSNVAMAYTHNKVFSEKGIKLLIDYFKKRGHSVKVFVPQHKRSRNHPLLEKWYEEGIVVFTPSRKLGKKSITSYDDRYILEYATTCDGIVVSQDQFRDLYAEKSQYRETIEKRILVPTFVGDYVMFPEDPLGRNGPCLSDFLKH